MAKNTSELKNTLNINTIFIPLRWCLYLQLLIQTSSHELRSLYSAIFYLKGIKSSYQTLDFYFGLRLITEKYDFQK